MNRVLLKIPKRKDIPRLGVLLLVIFMISACVGQAQTGQTSQYQTTAAVRGSLVSSVSATGTVRAFQSATLVWKVGGTVDAVNASIGQKVKSQDILALLTRDSLPRSIILANADLIVAQQNLDNMLNSNSSLADAMKALSTANQNVKDAQDAYDHLTRARVPGEVIQQTLDNLNAAKDRLKSLESIYNRFFGYKYMADGRAAKARITATLTNLRQNITNLTAQYNWYTGQPDSIQVDKALAALNVAKAIQQDAQRQLDRVQGGNNPDDIAAAQARVDGAQSTLNLAKIIAPFSGTITKVSVQPADRVGAGQAAFRVDDLSSLVVDVKISEVDINSVTVGQPVTVTFDAIPDKTYAGQVSRVDQAASPSPTGVNFGVSITITNADDQVKPAMSASISITSKKIDNALLVPNKALRFLNGQRIVYIYKNGVVVPVNVRVGATDDKSSQVVGGDLKEGDLVIENPPAPTPSTP